MTDRELMAELIAAWESCKADLLMSAIKAIRERLEQPEQKQEWVGLTAAESKVLWNATKKAGEFAKAIEAKLKEKNR